MGFDVTFHSISHAELETYVFDVLEKPHIAEQRAKAIAPHDATRYEELIVLYNNAMRYWYNERKDADGQPIRGTNVASTFSLGIAALSGYLHPYWYSRDGALSLCVEEKPELADFFVSITDIEKSPLATFREDCLPLFNNNFSASGVVFDVVGLKAWVDEHQLFLSQRFEDDGLDALHRALDYCLKYQLLFMEATDIVVPLSNESFTNLDNFRAHFLNNL